MEIKEKLSASDYHGSPHLGSSSLKLALISPAHYKSSLTTPKKQTAAMELGELAHAAILEQDFSRYLKGPVDDKRLKAWKDFEAENEASDKILMKPRDHDDLKGMFDSFFTHPSASKIRQNGTAELSIFGEDEETGLPIKARIDYLVQHSSGNYIFDYKTTTDATSHNCRNQITSYRYDLSMAHYKYMAEKALKLAIKDVFMIFEEKETPYGLKVYRLADKALEQGFHDRNKALMTIKQCTDKNDWPCYDTKIEEIDMPPWAYSKFNGEFE